MEDDNAKATREDVSEFNVTGIRKWINTQCLKIKNILTN